MKRHVRVLMVLFILLCASALPVRGQSLGGLIEQLGIRDLARDYLRPAVDAVGYSINSALSHTAVVDSGFTLRIGGSFINTAIPAEQRQFEARIPATLTQLGYPDHVVTATVAGGSGAVLRSTQAENPDIQLPDGADFASIYFVMPQAAIGSVLGSELFIRGLPPVTYTEEIGKVSFFGLGLKHNPTYFAELPFDIAFVASWHSFSIGDMVSGSSMAGLAQLSVTSGAVTLYGGLGYEAYSIDVSYMYEDESATLPSQRIDLEFRRRNLRFSAGASLSLFDSIYLAGDYSFGEQNNLSISSGILF
jgi:hypothetical protein